jgi:hypothetical protein
MFFFRSDDGNWRMFPPECERPAMRTTYLSERSLVLST